MTDNSPLKPDFADARAKAGRDYIGVGVGAVILNDQGKILISQRGPKARNEAGKWEIPGGAVEWGETFAQAIVREVKEELNIVIRVKELMNLVDHIIPDEKQHWVSPTYICEIVSGTPTIMEPEKCSQIGWFTVEEAAALPLSLVTKNDIEALRKRKTRSEK